MADIQKVIKLKETPKLIKREEKEIPPCAVVESYNVKLSGVYQKDFAINLAEKIINQQKHNKLDRNKDKIYLDFNTLGIEESQDNIAKLMHYLKRFKGFGGIEDYKINDVRIIIIKPSVRDLLMYIKDFDNAGKNDRKIDYTYIKNGMSFVTSPGSQSLYIKGEKRSDIVNFLYDNNGVWKNYKEIKDEIINFDSESIKKAIKAMNKRFGVHTDNKFKELIESRMVKNGKRESYEYRWKF